MRLSMLFLYFSYSNLYLDVKGNSKSTLLLPHIPYATIAACQMGLVPHLTQASPPIYRFRLCDLEAGDLLDMLKMNEMRIKIMVE